MKSGGPKIALFVACNSPARICCKHRYLILVSISYWNNKIEIEVRNFASSEKSGKLVICLKTLNIAFPNSMSSLLITKLDLFHKPWMKHEFIIRHQGGLVISRSNDNSFLRCTRHSPHRLSLNEQNSRWRISSNNNLSSRFIDDLKQKVTHLVKKKVPTKTMQGCTGN